MPFILQLPNLCSGGGGGGGGDNSMLATNLIMPCKLTLIALSRSVDGTIVSDKGTDIDHPRIWSRLFCGLRTMRTSRCHGVADYVWGSSWKSIGDVGKNGNTTQKNTGQHLCNPLNRRRCSL